MTSKTSLFWAMASSLAPSAGAVILTDASSARLNCAQASSAAPRIGKIDEIRMATSSQLGRMPQRARHLRAARLVFMYSTTLLNGQKKGLWRTVDLWLMMDLRRMEPSFESWIERFTPAREGSRALLWENLRARTSRGNATAGRRSGGPCICRRAFRG